MNDYICYALMYFVLVFSVIVICDIYKTLDQFHHMYWRILAINLYDNALGALILTFFGTVAKILTDYIFGG